MVFPSRVALRRELRHLIDDIDIVTPGFRRAPLASFSPEGAIREGKVWTLLASSSPFAPVPTLTRAPSFQDPRDFSTPYTAVIVHPSSWVRSRSARWTRTSSPWTRSSIRRRLADADARATPTTMTTRRFARESDD